MTSIEILSANFLKAFYANAKEECGNSAKRIIRDIEKNEWQFKYIDDYYNVAKALYYLNVQDDDGEISIDTNCAIYKLMYYCLLKNYILSNLHSNTASLINGAKLMLIILCEQSEYFMYGILTGQLGYMPNYAQKHIGDQLKLFGGIVKESNAANTNEQQDHFIDKRFSNLVSGLMPHMPSGISLESFKTGGLSSIGEIIKDLEIGFISSDDEDWL